MHSFKLIPKYPPIGGVRRGDLKGLHPISSEFGFDRGLPLDRIYIEHFLSVNAAAIRGRVLEIGDNVYTTRFGGSEVKISDVLHVKENAPGATIIGDLSDLPHVPDEQFDCIILTQTLHLIYDFEVALNSCLRLLKKGGKLIMTVPGITPIDHDEWKDVWYYSFTPASVKRMLDGKFSEVVHSCYGNVSTATAFLYGLSASEIPEKELMYHDPYYPVIVAAIATR